jgi:hypothetical protein
MTLLKTLLKPICLSLFLCLPMAASAAPKVYSGKEAQAIRCAQLMIYGSQAGLVTGVMSEKESLQMRVYGLMILHKYISGTGRQKIKAIEQMIEKTGFQESSQRFVKQARTCTRQFPAE